MVNIPNAISLARIIGIPFFISALYFPLPHANIIAAAIFALLCISDFVDGKIARKLNQTSKNGALLDHLADKLLIISGLIFLIGKGIPSWMAFVIIAREFIVTYLRIITNKIAKASYFGKIKATTQMIAILGVLLNIPYNYYILLAATIITAISGIDYLWQTRQELKI